MITIRSAEDFARILATHPDQELKAQLQVQADRLAEYDDFDLAELAMFAIVEPSDALKIIDAALGLSLLEGETFARPVELIALHCSWIEATFILSDDGFGLVLFVPLDGQTDKRLLTACKHALIQAQQL